TAERCAGSDVLVIQDTTVVRSSGGGGLYLHVAIALDATDGALLGLVHASFLTRKQGRRARRGSRPIKDKESRRSLEGAEAAARVCAKARRITVVADRESDIYEAFARRPAAVDLLVRAAQDRALADGEQLFSSIDSEPSAGQTTIAVPAKAGRAAREAKLAVRFMPVELKRPGKGVRHEVPASVRLSLVDTREVEPPRGIDRLHWRLLTTWPVNALSEALLVTSMYRCRWMIEQLFRTMKTQGFDIEALRTETEAPLQRLVTATLIAAVTVQQLLHARDGKSARPLSDVLAPGDVRLLQALNNSVEGKTARQQNPHPPDSLAYAAWVCGRLGGWTGYYGEPARSSCCAAGRSSRPQSRR
ncbi:MAG: IS4 family transposase, partial [Steroidobacteraceae bacterium]